MDDGGIEKTIVLTDATGQEFDDILRKYAAYRDRFEPWGGFNYLDSDLKQYGRSGPVGCLA